jgi:SAM-dependent methyltransferase
MNCRHCKAPLINVFLDLGFAPPSNAYLTAEELRAPEKHYPLKLFVCDRCWLVQTEDFARADELFRHDYAYFSSTSAGWLDHAARYARAMTDRLALGPQSLVIEVASNDGYLLKNFVAADIPCLGIEPTASTAAAAEKLGVPVLREFFGEALGKRLASEGRQADLIAGNNVYAHVPDINDFTAGLKAALKPNGTITLEFPHLMRLISTRSSTPCTTSIFRICPCTPSSAFSSRRDFGSSRSRSFQPMAAACASLVATPMTSARPTPASPRCQARKNVVACGP